MKKIVLVQSHVANVAMEDFFVSVHEYIVLLPMIFLYGLRKNNKCLS